MPHSAEPSKPQVLCVDDDPANLELLSRHLRGLCEVSTALSGEAALAVLSHAPDLAVIVSDMNMPRMDGAALLARVKKDAPTVVRVMLTGESDQLVAAQAINNGQIFRFLMKSCSREELRGAIEDSIEQHRLLIAERALLEGTLIGAIQALMDALAVVNPVAFSRAHRIRRMVIELALRAGVKTTWSLEAAALLSQLGYIAVPQEALERLLRGDRLSNSERRQLDRVPSVACGLIKKVPRMEPVVRIIESLDSAFAPTATEEITSTDILRLAADFDRYLVQTGDPQRALAAVQSHFALYSASLLPILAAHLGAELQAAIIREVALGRVTAGMVLIDGVRTDTGALVVPANFEVTTGFLERLTNFPASVTERLVRVRVYERPVATAQKDRLQ